MGQREWEPTELVPLRGLVSSVGQRGGKMGGGVGDPALPSQMCCLTAVFQLCLSQSHPGRLPGTLGNKGTAYISQLVESPLLAMEQKWPPEGSRSTALRHASSIEPSPAHASSCGTVTGRLWSRRHLLCTQAQRHPGERMAGASQPGGAARVSLAWHLSPARGWEWG